MNCAVLVNTCPKYFYLLEAYFGLLRRYSNSLSWPIYLATEKPEDPIIQKVSKLHKIEILPLEEKYSDFLESRWAAVKLLPKSIRFVLPLQDDFLLERPGIDVSDLKHCLDILESDEEVASIRLMPCPGSSAKEGFWGDIKKLLSDDLLFSYQATIWRREVYSLYFEKLIEQGHMLHPELTGKDWNQYCIRINPAETHPGMVLLKKLFPSAVHLCWPRKGPWANAVYHCPWPYRPTAVVGGVLQPWAIELIQREGFPLPR